MMFVHFVFREQGENTRLSVESLQLIVPVQTLVAHARQGFNSFVFLARFCAADYLLAMIVCLAGTDKDLR